MPSKYPEWLEEALFYQIYPQSFYDSNGDGIGDIAGIIDKLDYIESLGVNAIWLNACFTSPFADAGYDISDYYTVAPRYGKNDDLGKLFRTAQERGIRVCLDLVPGHTSIEHPWFKESCQAEENEYTNRYIWTDSVFERDLEGLTTVNGYGERDGNFITNFFYCQPALNYGFARTDPERPWQLPTSHPDVMKLRQEMKEIIRFWLDMGADGFRVDMAFSLVKNDPDWKVTSEFWRDVRKMMDSHYPEAVLISEWGSPSHAIRAGFHADLLLHVHGEGYTSLFRNGAYLDERITEGSFFSRKGGGNISVFLDEYMGHYRKVKRQGFIAVPSGSHDVPRISLGRTKDELALVYVFLLTLPGIPFLYYGDEIGMRYIGGLTSREGGYTRCGSRTPMQWTSGVNAGFSKAGPEKLYLPVDDSEGAPNVQDQLNQEDSILNTIRNLIRLRKQNPALQAGGDFIPIYAEEGRYPLVYFRSAGKNKIMIAVNPSSRSATASFKLPTAETFVELKMVEGIRLRENKGVFNIKMDGLSYGIFSC